MSQADREARMLAAIYREYGVQASWTPAGGGQAQVLTVRHDTTDDATPMGQGHALQRVNLIYLRLSEPFQPAKDDAVQTPRGAFRIARKPRLTDDGLEWLCEANGT